MAYRVAIIGSFRKYHEEIIDLATRFRALGLQVESPRGSSVSGRIEDFVLFREDNPDHTPEDIQTITLGRLLDSDAVYVHDPSGYVGKTTGYEIGFLFGKRKPVYYLCRPRDLPVPVNDEQIMSADAFAQLVLENRQGPSLDFDMCLEASESLERILGRPRHRKPYAEKRVIICGSMHFYGDMVRCRSDLANLGIASIAPIDETPYSGKWSADLQREFKRSVSSAYLRKIRHGSTTAVLVVNGVRRGVPNYIGANTLAELAMAFAWNRRMFLYHDVYAPLEDELRAWGAIPLHGNLKLLADAIRADERRPEDSAARQLSLEMLFRR